MRLIAWVSVISGLFSFVSPIIFDFVCGPVALVGLALGILALILEWNDPKTRRLAVIGILTAVAWVIWVWAGGLLWFVNIPVGPR